MYNDKSHLVKTFASPECNALILFDDYCKPTFYIHYHYTLWFTRNKLFRNRAYIYYLK